MIERWGALVVRRALVVLLVGLGITAAAAIAGIGLEDKLSAGGFVCIGDPDDCAAAVQKWADVGFDQLTFSPTTNTLDTEVVVQSMELFGREVIPQFDKDPVHSTTRYREAAGGAPA